MKNIKITFITTVLTMLVLMGCSEDILETSPADAFAEDQI